MEMLSAESTHLTMVVGQTKPDHVDPIQIHQDSDQDLSGNARTEDDADLLDGESTDSEESGGLSGSGRPNSIELSPSPGSTRAEKRGVESVAARHGKAKRLRGFYNNDYRRLLNSDIAELVSPDSLNDRYDPLPASQIGVSLWTSAEKEIFFAALPKLGKDNTRGIATRIGSKSALEVHEYIKLLQQGIVEQNVNEERPLLSGLLDIPAAIQVSEECCDILERSAEALALRQERYEESLEKTKWGESWLLTYEVNDWVEEQLKDESGNHALDETLPAAKLLNLGNWLKLSTRIFMNPAEPRIDENWQCIIEPGEQPGIRATAFSDFHTLAVSLTKRLVSATIFCAMSRLRATDANFFERREDITRADVHAAAKTLGLELDSSKFWTGCARRCNLEVHQKLSAIREDGLKMDYDDVEHLLSQFSRKGRSHTSIEIPFEDNQPDSDDSPLLEDRESEGSTVAKNDLDSDINSDAQESSHAPALHTDRDLAAEYTLEMQIGPLDPSDSEFENPRKHVDSMQHKLQRKREQERATDRYLEAVDIQVSLAQEKNLWEMLKQDPPFAISPEDIEIPNPPAQGRKEGDELVDWRDRVEFWSEWEVFETPVPREASVLHRRKRQRRGVDPSGAVGKIDDEIGESDTESAEVSDSGAEDRLVTGEKAEGGEGQRSDIFEGSMASHDQIGMAGKGGLADGTLDHTSESASEYEVEED